MSKLHSSCKVMASLLTLARQGALLYNIMCRQFGQLSSQRLENWKHFSRMYCRALSSYAEKNSKAVKKLQSGTEDVDAVLKEILQHLNREILQDAFRYVLQNT